MAPTIGFDFDECLAHAYTIVPLALLLNKLLPRSLSTPEVSPSVRVLLEKSRAIFFERVAANEVKTKGTLFRPSLLKFLPRLLKLRNEGHINHMFIYSNNGLKIVLDTVDHILALTLKKDPYRVPESHFIREESGLHVLSPRIFLDEVCRSVEPKEANGFREKSLEGIRSCVGDMDEADLWFLDDSRMHEKLMNSLKERYVVMKPYNVKLANKVLAEILLHSFSTDAFTPGTPEGSVFLAQLQTIFPTFSASGRETRKSLHEKLTKALNTFSPYGGGHLAKGWKDTDVAADLQYIETSLRPLLNSATAQTAHAQPDLTYREPVGGRLIRAPVSSRRRRNRTALTRRRRSQ